MNISSRAEAIETGAKRYFTGRPCLRGHIAARATVNKTCVECGAQKNPSAASTERTKIRQAAWYVANAERLNKRGREYHAANRERFSQRIAEYCSTHKAETAQRRREHYLANKGDYFAAARKRQEHVLRATPSWANHKEIAEIYRRALAISKQTGIKHHVDHEIPLRGRFVCGLHVESNLRVIPARENLAKKNTWVSE